MHPLAVGMYIRTICFQWGHDSVPNDDRKIQQITGTTPQEFNDHWSEVRQKLMLTEDDTWINERAQVEMDHKLTVALTRSDCGKLGGRPKSKRVSKRVSKTKAKGKAKRKQKRDP